MIHHFGKRLMKLRRFLSRCEWSVHLLALPRTDANRSQTGLLLVQIDGLSQRQLEIALQRRRMPFLRRLLRREGYHLHTLYSGLPSSTPAVQGELFYGVKCAVPAFSFRDRQSGQIMSMLKQSAAKAVEQRLERSRQGVLAGGSAYSDIYSGGAAESHFGPTARGSRHYGDATRRWQTLVILLAHIGAAVRIGALLCVEFVLALVDCIRGLINRRELLQELIFVPTRVAVCILLRELVTLGAKIDLARGVPVIHLNYLGYDEQAHRRGPSSLFAHWTLKGIDGSIRDLWQAARRSRSCHYDVWIYSDHGQEDTQSYTTSHGKTIHQAIQELFQREPDDRRHGTVERSVQLERVKWLGLPFRLRLPAKSADNDHIDRAVVVTAKGPIGHVYPAMEMDDSAANRMAQAMVQELGVPLVMRRGPGSAVTAWTADGIFLLPRDAEQVLGHHHPFLATAAADLVRLTHHPDAGAFVISGWRCTGQPMSFPVESGAHAGPGAEETRAFALLPSDAPLPSPEKLFLRPLDLHHAIEQALRPQPSSPPRHRRSANLAPETIRVMTYNVHSCVGADGKLSPARIAKVISGLNPDVVALQEVDVRRPRTQSIDQAHEIAKFLEMEFHFHPAITVEEEQYGNAVLSRWPMKLVKAEAYPCIRSRRRLEPRGAIWVEILFGDRRLQLINTHFGLGFRERWTHVDHLLGENWIGGAASQMPLVVCGDFNTLPISPVYHKLARRLVDTQRGNSSGRPYGTWFGHFPIGRIDYIFASHGIKVVATTVPRNDLTRRASDHLPLAADLEIW